MRRLVSAGLLPVLALGACTTVTTEEDKSSPGVRPEVTTTETVTKDPPPTVPPRAAPPENPAPRGPADACGYTSNRPTLDNGSTGSAVQQAQCLLNLSMSGERLAEDGSFGPVTEAAVRRFQACAGITVDGVVGPQTWSYLVYWASAPAYLC